MRGWVLASSGGGLLVQFALAPENPHLLVKILNLLLGGVGVGLLVQLALMFERLDFLTQFLDLFFQGFNLRRFHGLGGPATRSIGGDFGLRGASGVGGRVIGSRCRENKLQPGKGRKNQLI